MVLLQVHPDKNPYPQAGEAFKALSQAFDCLSDAHSRAAHFCKLVREGAAVRSNKRRKRNGSDSSQRASKMRSDSEQDVRKWWEGRSWVEIEKAMKREELKQGYTQRKQWEGYRSRKAAKSEVGAVGAHAAHKCDMEHV